MAKEATVAGFIIVHRVLEKHWIWDNPLHLKSWLYLLFRANHEPVKIPFNQGFLELQRGEFITSIEHLALGVRCGIQQMRSFLGLLVADGMIEKKSYAKSTKITICNYSKYQDKQQTNNKQITNKQQTNNKQITTENNTNNENNENNTNNKTIVGVDFEKIWNQYKRPNSNKKTSRTAWDNISEKNKKLIEIHVPLYMANTEIQYRKLFETYLHQEHWNSEVFVKPEPALKPGQVPKESIADEYKAKFKGFEQVILK